MFNDETITGQFTYFGHGSSSALYIGQQHIVGTNLYIEDVSMLSNENLADKATIELNSCNSGKWGENSIAYAFYKQLNRPTSGWTNSVRFTHIRGTWFGYDKPPEEGPLYMIVDPPGQYVTYGGD